MTNSVAIPINGFLKSFNTTVTNFAMPIFDDLMSSARFVSYASSIVWAQLLKTRKELPCQFFANEKYYDEQTQDAKFIPSKDYTITIQLSCLV